MKKIVYLKPSVLTMKRVIHIASVLALVSLFSCQKEEFRDAFEQTEDNIQKRITTSPAPEESNSASSGESSYVPDQTSETRRDDVKIIDVMVKEISDGDDEADGGDDSRERE